VRLLSAIIVNYCFQQKMCDPYAWR